MATLLLFVAVICVWLVVIDAAEKTALITGGAGFVGRHFTHRLCNSGWHVTIVDNLVSESSIHPIKWPEHLKCLNSSTFTFLKMDCRHFFKSKRSAKQFDLFLHLAAVVGGRAVIEGSPLLVADDLSIDAAAFQWAIDETSKPKPSKMIFFSSSAAYPVRYQYFDSRISLTEKMIDLKNVSQDIGFPDLSYGWAKLTGEYLAQLAHETKKLNVVTYRPMSGYGEDQNRVYPFIAILERVMRRENPVKVWSNATRDFMYIEDIVDCVLETMDSVSDGSPINLGTGVATSFEDLSKLMASIEGYSPTVIVDQGKPAGVAYRVGDPVNLQKHGCRAKTNLSKGIDIALKYLKTTKVEAPQPTTDSKTESPKFSDFQCIGGSQTFAGMKLQHTHADFPEADAIKNRVCKLNDVCIVNKKIVYYENSEVHSSLQMSAFNGHLVHSGYVGGPWAPQISNSQVPSNLPYDSEYVYFYTSNSFDDNFGHLLNDDLFPVLTASNVFNIPTSKAKLIHNSCNNGQWTDTTPCVYDKTKTRKQVCMENMNAYSPLVLGSPAIDLQSVDDKCFKELIVGQSSAFSLRSIDLERGITLRTARNAIVQNLRSDVAPPTTNRIMVILKRAGYQGPPEMQSLCEDVKRVTKEIDASLEVYCVDPLTISVTEQINEVRKSTVLIAEHGTTSYSILFANDGTVLLSIGSVTLLKEPQILLFGTHFETIFLAHENYKWLKDYVQQALRKAQRSL